MDALYEKLLIFGGPLFQIPNSDAVPAKPFEDCLPALMLSKSFNSGAPEEGGGRDHALPRPQIFSDNLTLFQPGGADHAHHITTSPSQIFVPSFVSELLTQSRGGEVFFCALRPLRADGI